VDVEAATARGIVVGKAVGGPGTGAPELTMGLILALLRKIAESDAAMHAGEWPTPLGYELGGKTLGLVGLGNVGGQVARLARAFGPTLLAYSPSLTLERAAQVGCEAVSLEDLLKRSNVVSIHVPLNAGTKGLIDEHRLGLMKPWAFLINTSRGPVVDERALVQALAAGKLAGAALDVYDEEPLPADHPLRKLPNVVLTPHIGWPTDQGFERFAGPAVDVILAYAEGRDFPRFN
jgi:phosphoglycerate dehydrogenase-like enzyme